MPIYEYVCSACGKLNEAFQKVNDPAPEKCDGCGASGTLTKALSRTSFVLKGGGWYSDLYGSVKKDSGSTSSSSSSSTSSGASDTKKSSDSGSASTSGTSSGSGVSGSGSSGSSSTATK